MDRQLINIIIFIKGTVPWEKDFNFLSCDEIWRYESARIVYQNVTTTAVTLEAIFVSS
jgi:hypothetical protein